jgi:hypothetical protein
MHLIWPNIVLAVPRSMYRLRFCKDYMGGGHSWQGLRNRWFAGLEAKIRILDHRANSALPNALFNIARMPPLLRNATTLTLINDDELVKSRAE